jgi:hypothetical protein
VTLLNETVQVKLVHLQPPTLGTFGAEELGSARNNLPVVRATIGPALELRGLLPFTRSVPLSHSVAVGRQTRLACVASMCAPSFLELSPLERKWTGVLAYG